MIAVSWSATEYFLDPWVAVHFLSGILLALLFLRLTKLSKWEAFIVAFELMILWEFFEIPLGAGEEMVNIISDMIFGSLGFMLGVFVHKYQRIRTNVSLLILASLLAVLATIGWANMF